MELGGAWSQVYTFPELLRDRYHDDLSLSITTPVRGRAHSGAVRISEHWDRPYT